MLEFILKNVNNLSEYVMATALSNVIVDESLVSESKELQLFISSVLKYLQNDLSSNKSNDTFSKFISTFGTRHDS